MATKVLIPVVKNSHGMTQDVIIFIARFVVVTAKHMATNAKRSPMELLLIKTVNVQDPSDDTCSYSMLA